MNTITLPQLARNAIAHYLATGRQLEVPTNKPDAWQHPAGVFISLHVKENNELRGCIGTFRPTCPLLAEEVITNAIAAATQDPRFRPVTAEELPQLEISVDILSPPKLIQRHFQLGKPIPPEVAPKKNGLIVSCLGQRGLLLPDIPGVTTPEEQLEICHRKAGIAPGTPVDLSIFTVTRMTE